MGDDQVVAQLQTTVVDKRGTRWCAWCDEEFTVPPSGITLWLKYGWVEPDPEWSAGGDWSGSILVCSEGCAMEARQADAIGFPVYRGRAPIEALRQRHREARP